MAYATDRTLSAFQALKDAAGRIVILHSGFEAVAAVSEDELGELLNDPDMMESFGDMVDPYRSIRGEGIGRPGMR